MSEHNYEEPIDEERAIRLLNFGDDYRNYIDSLSDGFSSVNEHNRLRLRNKRRTYKKYKVRGMHPKIDRWALRHTREIGSARALQRLIRHPFVPFSNCESN